MKKKMLMLLTVVAMTTTYAYSQTSFAIRGGINWQNLNGKDESGASTDYKLATKWHVGIQANVPVATDFYFQPGLIFNNKGAKAAQTFLGQQVTGKINMSYIDVPLSLVYKPQVGTGRVILGFGPYVGFGIGGKVKFEGGGASESSKIAYKNDVTQSDPQDKVYFKRIDAGANIFAGYEFTQSIFVQLNTQLGLVNIEPKNNGQKPTAKTKHTGFGISLGYNF